jgi:hypothetical protein
VQDDGLLSCLPLDLLDLGQGDPYLGEIRYIAENTGIAIKILTRENAACGFAVIHLLNVSSLTASDFIL